MVIVARTLACHGVHVSCRHIHLQGLVWIIFESVPLSFLRAGSIIHALYWRTFSDFSFKAIVTTMTNITLPIDSTGMHTLACRRADRNPLQYYVQSDATIIQYCMLQIKYRIAWISPRRPTVALALMDHSIHFPRRESRDISHKKSHQKNLGNKIRDINAVYTLPSPLLLQPIVIVQVPLKMPEFRTIPPPMPLRLIFLFRFRIPLLLCAWSLCPNLHDLFPDQIAIALTILQSLLLLM